MPPAIHCVTCGCSLARQWIAQDERERYVCTSCGTTHYQNPRVIVICFAYWADKILMCCRAQDPERGKWLPPSGFLECGETIEEGAAREVFEETGVVLDPSKLELYAVINLPAIEQLAISFRVKLDMKPITKPGHECLAADFLAEDEVADEQLAWPESVGDIVHDFFREIRSERFSIRVVSIASDRGLGIRSRRYEIASNHSLPNSRPAPTTSSGE